MADHSEMFRVFFLQLAISDRLNTDAVKALSLHFATHRGNYITEATHKHILHIAAHRGRIA